MAVLASLSPVRVEANHDGIPFGSTACGGTPVNCVSVGNNNQHRVYFNNLTANMSSALTSTMNLDYAPTDLFMVTETVWATRDASANDDYYNLNGAAGWVVCANSSGQGTDVHGHRWCQSSLYFNFSYGSFFATAQQRDYMACHELGHTLGLRHHAGSCMEFRSDNGNGLGTLNLSDVQHLNAEY
jgi:hypothetical protein